MLNEFEIGHFHSSVFMTFILSVRIELSRTEDCGVLTFFFRAILHEVHVRFFKVS